MIRKMVKMCSAILLVVPVGVQAAEILYADCLNESDRAMMRNLTSECDTYATGVEGSNFYVGIYRPVSPSDNLSAIEVPDCQSDSHDNGAHGYGRDPWYNTWYGGSALYVCVGAP
jgi:hypothetical protein